MTRAEIMERLKSERIGNRVWDEISKWDRACLLAELEEIVDTIERAGLIVIPAEADEAEVERVARALCKVKGFDPDANETSACDEGIAWSFWREHEEQATAACAAVREAGKE